MFIVIDPRKITIEEKIFEDVEKSIKHIKSSVLDENSNGIFYPGEDYVKSREIQTKEGIIVDDTVWNEIIGL